MDAYIQCSCHRFPLFPRTSWLFAEVGHYLFGEGLDEGADVAGVAAGVEDEVGDADFCKGLDGRDHVLGAADGVTPVRIYGVNFLLSLSPYFPLCGLDSFLPAVGECTPGQEAPSYGLRVSARCFRVAFDGGLSLPEPFYGGLGGEEAVAEASGPAQHALWGIRSCRWRQSRWGRASARVEAPS